MNNYQEALNRIAKYCGVNNGSMFEDDLKTLQELVDRATPKKLLISTLSNHSVGVLVATVRLAEGIIQNFVVGQALDWSE